MCERLGPLYCFIHLLPHQFGSRHKQKLYGVSSDLLSPPGRLYAMQTGMKLDSKTPECRKFLVKLMDQLETVSFALSTPGTLIVFQGKTACRVQVSLSRQTLYQGISVLWTNSDSLDLCTEEAAMRTQLLKEQQSFYESCSGEKHKNKCCFLPLITNDILVE